MSDISDNLSHADTDELMLDIGARNPTGNLHGYLCGHLSAGVKLSDDQWLSMVVEFMDADEIAAPAGTALAQFLAATVAQLEDVNNGFYPLLPADEEDLSHRIQVFSDWCDGYLEGFAMFERPGKSNELSDIVNDALRDIAAMARIRVGGAEPFDREGEGDYMQVVEHVRMAVISIYLEFNFQAQGQQAQGQQSQGQQPEDQQPQDRQPQVRQNDAIHDSRGTGSGNSVARLFKRKLH